jgi:hypothetical protein
LSAFLPATLEGYQRTRDEGSTGKYGDVSVSEAERVFSRGDHQVTVRIVDTTLSRQLGDRIVAAAEVAKSREAADPTAPIFLAETVGFVRYDHSASEAEANLWVGERFVVAVSTRGHSGTDEARRVARNLDLAGLAKLR